MKVLAHQPSGSAQKGCICLPYTAPELSAGLSLSNVQDGVNGICGQGKGERLVHQGIMPLTHGNLLQCCKSVWSQA